MSLPPPQLATSLARSQFDQRSQSVPLLPLRGVLQLMNVPNVPAARADAAAEGAAVKIEANDDDEGDQPRRRASTGDTSGSALTPLPEDMSPVNAVQAALVDRYEPGGVSCADWEFRVPRARLDDYLADNLDVLFCGVGPGPEAVRLNVPFPDQNNHRFYQTLQGSNWTDRLHQAKDAITFPARYGIGMTTMIRDHRINHTTPEVKRHVPALIEKILRYRPRVMCLLAIGDVLRAVERVFHRWAGEKKVDPVGAYRDQPVSSDWILRKWRIKLSDEGKGDEWTYIVVVINPGGRASIPFPRRVASFQIVRDLIAQLKSGSFQAPEGMRTVNLGPYHQIIADRDQMIADLNGRRRSLPPRKRSASPSPSPVGLKRPRVGQSPRVNAVAGPSGTRHESLDPIPAPNAREVEMDVDDAAADGTSAAGASEPDPPLVEGDEDNKAAVADLARVRAADQEQQRQRLAELQNALERETVEKAAAVARATQELAWKQEMAAELERVRAEYRDLAANFDRLTAEHAPFKAAIDAAAARSVPSEASGSGTS